MIGANVNKQAQIPIKMQFISKTVECADGIIVKGIDVETHCKIVGLVAKELISLLPEWLIVQLFPPGTDFIAACHDIGKISPDFQIMIHKNITGWDRNDYPELAGAYSERAKRKAGGFHAKVSQVCLESKSPVIAKITWVHHGFKPDFRPYTEAAYGGLEWTNKRHILVATLEKYFNINSENWPQITESDQINIISGLVTVADWIGSGGIFADLCLNTKITDSDLHSMAKQAVKEAGFARIETNKNLSFKDIFEFEPRPIQNKLIEAINNPGLYILEAPMGIGKTEAALFAAYKLLDQKKASGIYFALPTQLTSNKIYERVNKFLLKINQSESNLSFARLLHSLSWLEEKVFGADADSGGSWFDGSKRGILAPFAVGTIDQALMSVMNVKHSFVRTFGLAGKVVILDEVHSYDTYTGTIINRLIECLQRSGCTVIILSATLTEAQKKKILSINYPESLHKEYPLITALPADINQNNIKEVTDSNGEETKIEILHSTDSWSVINTVLEKAEQGQQVLWIENTIMEAQEIFKHIRARADLSRIECGLLHSRFLKKERSVNEDYWVSIYGKDGSIKRKEKGRILVGTQILEQSLDIDADFIVTRLCPTDMLLQRLGRLWRHKETIRPESARRQALIIAPLYENIISESDNFGKSSAVYSKYVLCRSLEIWENIANITLPRDIRDLLENTYSDCQETGYLLGLKNNLSAKIEKLKSWALLGLSSEVNTLPESQAQTRYSEIESTDVLLIRSFSQKNKKITIRLLDNSILEFHEFCYNKIEKRKVSSLIIQNTVRVSEYIAPKRAENLKWIEDYVYIGTHDEEQPFRVAIVGKDDEIRSLNNTDVNDKYNLWYDSVCGYREEKKGGEND